MTAQKINWKLFWKESSVLVAHTLLAAFFFRIGQVLNEYYKLPVLSALAFIISVMFAVPLLINLFDLWARTIASVREEAVAEKILKCSITIHNTFFGRKNAYMSEKQAILASLYYDMGKSSESEELFKESWKNYNDSLIKFPWLHPAFADYTRILSTTGDTEALARVQASLTRSRYLHLGQKICTILITTPIVTFLMMNQYTERNIAKHNAHGQIILALKEVTGLANREAQLLGEYAAARVYSDYAQAFDDTPGQSSEMLWCVNKCLDALQRSGTNDEYLKVLMLNLKAKAILSGKKPEDAIALLQESVNLCSNWDDKKLARNRYDAAMEREKSLLTLAELKRNQSKYSEAESLYVQLLGTAGSKVNNSQLKVPLFSDPVETVDRLHKFQHVEQKLGKKNEAIELQKKVCGILEDSVQKLTRANTSSALCDFGIREAARELDVCAFMLQESGRDTEAKAFHERADKLRKSRHTELRLDAQQQDSVVDETTRITNELLAVKYKADDWKQSLHKLLNEDLTSKKARGAFERLPWYDANRLNLERSKSEKSQRRLEINIAPLSIRNNREGDGINVDVQGTVKIFSANSKSADEQRFDFAYVVKEQKNRGRPFVEDLLDNQVLASFN